ncbi:YXWGXW repeat-containing protein [Flavitalea flava]
MNKQLLMIAFAGCLFIGSTGCSVEGGVVETRPAEVVYSRPITPGPDYIWIDGDWRWSGGRYVWHNGYWGRHRGRTWQTGQWQSSGHGWRWQRGHWR